MSKRKETIQSTVNHLLEHHCCLGIDTRNDSVLSFCIRDVTCVYLMELARQGDSNEYS